MKLSLVLTAVFVALSSAATLPRGLPLTKQYFKLKVADNAPKEVAGKYITISGSLGIYPGREEFQGYINGTSTKKGAILSVKDKKDKVSANLPLPEHRILIWLSRFLRPTHGTPVYYVRLGDPNDDARPELILWKDFTVSPSDKSKKPKYWLDYNASSNSVGATSKNWVACGGKDGYQLYL